MAFGFPKAQPLAPDEAPPMLPADFMDETTGMAHPFVTAPPQVVQPTPGQNLIDADQAKLEKVRWAQANPWGTAANHPGKLGHIAHVLSVAGDIAGNIVAPGVMENIPGTQLNLQEKEREATRQLGTDIGNESLNQERAATTAAAKSEIPLHEAQTAAAKLIEITPELADQIGNPALTGQHVTQGVLQHLLTTADTNQTKIAATGATVQGRKDVAQTTNQSHESVAQAQAQSRERIASATNAMRQTLESMRDASGIAKINTAADRKAAPGSQPTIATRTMGEMAATVIPQMHGVKAEVDHMATALGPAVGRWNELMVNKGGTDFPEFAGLDTDLDLLASAIVRTHFGARGGQQYRQELRKQFGEAQTPEDLKARIDSAEKWIQGYANAGKVSPAQGGSEPKVLKFNSATGRLE